MAVCFLASSTQFLDPLLKYVHMIPINFKILNYNIQLALTLKKVSLWKLTYLFFYFH